MSKRDEFTARLDKIVTEAACEGSDAMKAVRRTVRALLARGETKRAIIAHVRRIAPKGIALNAIECMVHHEADTQPKGTE